MSDKIRKAYNMAGSLIKYNKDNPNRVDTKTALTNTANTLSNTLTSKRTVKSLSNKMVNPIAKSRAGKKVGKDIDKFRKRWDSFKDTGIGSKVSEIGGGIYDGAMKTLSGNDFGKKIISTAGDMAESYTSKAGKHYKNLGKDIKSNLSKYVNNSTKFTDVRLISYSESKSPGIINAGANILNNLSVNKRFNKKLNKYTDIGAKAVSTSIINKNGLNDKSRWG